MIFQAYTGRKRAAFAPRITKRLVPDEADRTPTKPVGAKAGFGKKIWDIPPHEIAGFLYLR
jgi:hypothetical protein